MKKTLIVILIIPVLLFASAFALTGLAREQAQKEHIWLMETLLPGGKDFVRVPCEDADEVIRSVHQSSAGYVIETLTYGYTDTPITMMIAVDNDGKVMGLVVLDAHETPGLGGRILTDHRFLSQFLNKSGSFTVSTAGADAFSGATGDGSTTGEEIAVDGITGATVSSKAVVRSVNAAVAYVTGADIDSSATTWGG